MQIAIIGLGLIGGSLAKALKENTEHTVIGFDRDENTLLDALSLGAIDSVGQHVIARKRGRRVRLSVSRRCPCSFVAGKRHRILKKAALSRMCAASKIRSAAN